MRQIQSFESSSNTPFKTIEGADDAELQSLVMAKFFNVRSRDDVSNDMFYQWTSNEYLSESYRNIVKELKLTAGDLNRNEIVEQIANQIIDEMYKRHPELKH